MNARKPLLLIAINEVSFDAVKTYLEHGVKLPNFKVLIDGVCRTTSSEAEYSLLEPWIQWPSIYTGQAYDEHAVFRLGDSITCSSEQIFERLERAGYKVGVVSPMNAANRLKQPAYFIPDPWTQTHSDKSLLSRFLTPAIRQVVNDNSEGRLKTQSVLAFAAAFFYSVPISEYFELAKLVLSSRSATWRRAIFFDEFLHHVHLKLWSKYKPDFSMIFFNACAHIQHHYFHNSTAVTSEAKNPGWYVDQASDPLLEVLQSYDRLLGEFRNRCDAEFIIVTGLSQIPTKVPQFYYRLRRHDEFLRELGIRFQTVEPRMTRDFLVSFGSMSQARVASKKLENIRLSCGTPIFGEIDQRGHELFITLTVASEITENTVVECEGQVVNLAPHVVFVALKNGEHSGVGTAAFLGAGIEKNAPAEGSHVATVNGAILNYFNISGAA